MITINTLSKASAEFDEIEKRGSLYPFFVKLIDSGFHTEGYLLILSTWNTVSFRYAKFDLDAFIKVVDKINDNYSDFLITIKKENFRDIDFDLYSKEIVGIFELLRVLPGVYFTGASKVMHLMNRRVFMMWDQYISGNATGAKKYYEKLAIVQQGERIYKKYEKCGEGYHQFLKDMQNRFGNIDFQHPTKTLPKVVDEYNYVNITIPIQIMEKAKKELAHKK